MPDGEKLRLLRAGLLPLGIFAVHDGAVRQRLDLAGRKLGHRRLAAFLAAGLKGRMTRRCSRILGAQHAGISCMFMWIILAALGFGAVFDGLGAVKAIENLFTEQLGLSPG
jgi:hypothetical protein